ncbi:L-type lectin-domain containing receptor kinase IX.1 [Morella rubra]|uniref:non-specific serine/threonine protein kinase n=1 Tax=Morella rubra TaxID=262757 RepID=A0A6A1UJF2_9ROSI|nr:L-type lectin-domain containing receptor kinase IX.1 [Morella rubra]
MAISNIRANCLLQPRKTHPLLNQLFLLLLLLPRANSIFFNFSSFDQDIVDKYIKREGDAEVYEEAIQVTKNRRESISQSLGRASYKLPVQLWDASTGKVTDFMTHFSFVIDADVESDSGDGLAFFIAPFESVMPADSGGGSLGLFSTEYNFNKSLNSIVAVEFDTYKNRDWDPSDNHIGINVNSIVSEVNVTWNISIKNGTRTGNAWVSYNATTQNLSVFLTYSANPVFSGKSSLSYIVDLTKVNLTERARVGFSAATGDKTELHKILSWSFNSSLEVKNENRKNKVVLGIGLAVGIIAVLSCGLCLLRLIFRRKRAGGENEDLGGDDSMDVEFENGTGPRRFTFRELTRATNNFAEGGKLGEGGFGVVYRGLLSESNTEVAVKRISKGSKQGKREYISEVKIISRLRHRNLVQLIGWCHERGEFLLVYEYMPNRSLDSHLFGGKILLAWPVRYKIALGLASALLYLHEEWEQCVVHRDIKSSNVMLDSNFIAKLGDFGLARLVDHELGSQTTVLAGTLGYLAPECVTTGKASKESDVYSFGVVSLEIACGRKPVEPRAEPSKVRLLDWVWDLYGKGQILEAVDKKLSLEFDERQTECLMVVGLWCCHPDPTLRPSIRQVIKVLHLEAPLPDLPSKLPVPMYSAPPMHVRITSSGIDFSTKDQTQSSCSSCNPYSSNISTGSIEALLYPGREDA